MNLVVNARDAMTGGGSVTIQTADVELENSALHEEAIVQGHYVMLAITDTGGGITKEAQRHLFEPFFTTKEAGSGTGLRPWPVDDLRHRQAEQGLHLGVQRTRPGDDLQGLLAAVEP